MLLLSSNLACKHILRIQFADDFRGKKSHKIGIFVLILFHANSKASKKNFDSSRQNRASSKPRSRVSSEQVHHPSHLTVHPLTLLTSPLSFVSSLNPPPPPRALLSSPKHNMSTPIKTTNSNSKSPPNRLALLEARLRTPNDKLDSCVNPDARLATDLTPGLREIDDDVRSFSSSDGSACQPRLTLNVRRRYAPKAKGRDVGGAVKKRKRFSPASMKTMRVDSYFKTVSKEDPFSAPSTPRKGEREEDDTVGVDAYRYFRERIDVLMRENERLRETEKEVAALKAENEDLRTQLELELPDLRQELEAKSLEVMVCGERADKLARIVGKLAVELAKVNRRERREKLALDSERLGRVIVERAGTTLHEVWEDGLEWKKVEGEIKRLSDKREILEKKRKEVVKIKANAAKSEEKEVERGEMPPPKRPTLFEETVEYAVEQEEIYKVQLALMKREENALHEKRAQLVRERDVMVRELRRQNDERLSAFNNFSTLNDRYVLLNLLGRGGFSEVYKAFDVKCANYVACKIHQLASNWSEEKKKSFIRHAWREYKIHKSLKHPRVVKLVDIFEIDDNTFCTVLEYCEGCDLDSYLRLHKMLSEKEAKSIITQVFSGLQYLAEQKRRIIHYDLKPGNILLHNGEVQITDFGLSKVMSETENTAEGMELTSQGAGTMWYLPPECFETGDGARISVKVDVWSAGVILFQMLYGRKPFGHDQTQEKMFREKTVTHQELEFPSRPAVSDLAKDFMRRCLTRRATVRPDVQEALQHPFFKKR